MKISVVIPSYNEEMVIGRTLAEYRSFLAENFEEFEVIAVDDGSSDETRTIIQSFENVICISYPENRGKGYAVKRGFLRATGDYIFFTDADFSYSPANILRAVELFESCNCCGVVGVRENLKKDYPLLRRILSRAFSGLVTGVLKISVCDTQCGFKGFRRSMGKRIFSMLEVFDFGFDFEVIYLAQLMGGGIMELPVSFCHRMDSGVRLVRDGAGMVRDLFCIKRSRRNEAVKREL